MARSPDDGDSAMRSTAIRIGERVARAPVQAVLEGQPPAQAVERAGRQDPTHGADDVRQPVRELVDRDVLRLGDCRSSIPARWRVWSRPGRRRSRSLSSRASAASLPRLLARTRRAAAHTLIPAAAKAMNPEKRGDGQHPGQQGYGRRSLQPGPPRQRRRSLAARPLRRGTHGQHQRRADQDHRAHGSARRAAPARRPSTALPRSSSRGNSSSHGVGIQTKWSRSIGSAAWNRAGPSRDTSSHPSVST